MTGISKDLFLAILSMDAYNRGYNAGITGLTDANNTKIGNAKIVKASSSLETSEEVQAGFYAVAYEITGSGYGDLGSGDTVISYRGTDILGALPFWSAVSGDLWTGYGSALGLNIATWQSHLAAEFFQSVTETGSGDPRLGEAPASDDTRGPLAASSQEKQRVRPLVRRPALELMRLSDMQQAA